MGNMLSQIRNCNYKKFLKIFLCFSITLLASCSKDSNEPELIPLTIYRHFKTEILPVQLSEVDDFSRYIDRLVIVNSNDEIPTDEHFSVEALKKANINYSEHSLIIVYQLLLGDIATYIYNWYYNNWYDRYEFNTTYDLIKGSEYVDGESERFSYIRCAIVVRHIPSDSNWMISEGMFVQPN